MIIYCNDKEREVDEGLALSALLFELKLNPETVVVECNKAIVQPEEYDSFVLPEDARLELIRFVGGG
jgi:thiamine biosynthesis protein ThiS